MRNKYLLIIIAIIVIIVAVIIWNQQKKAPNQTALPAASVNTEIKFTGQAAIEISAVVTAGDSLTFSKVLMPGNGFVAVKDKNGKIIGASNLLIFPETRNFKTAIAVKAGQTYVAELHGDNGDGLFDPNTDPPFVVEGKTVTATFKAK